MLAVASTYWESVSDFSFTRDPPTLGSRDLPPALAFAHWAVFRNCALEQGLSRLGLR